VQFSDVTYDWGMIAVQGPRALEIAQPLVAANLKSLDYYAAAETMIAGHGGIASRTGYTGEDGCELIVGKAALVEVWERLAAAAADVGGQPAGLGARDTLRLEAGMPLYGHELSEEIDPLQAGLAFAVQLDKGEFLGREALARLKQDRSRPKRVGLALDGKRVPRDGYAVFAGSSGASTGGASATQNPGTQIGFVTSGTFSPSLDRPIAMAYLAPEHAKLDTQVTVDIRGRGEPARVVKLPFYRRGSSATPAKAVSQ
jgi:aminomethyltransferase